jgi:hypothetical protein
MPDSIDVRALLRPQTLLIAAIILLPLTMSLNGSDPRLGATTAFGLSDVLLLLALPWIIAQAVLDRTPRPPSLKRSQARWEGGGSEIEGSLFPGSLAAFAGKGDGGLGRRFFLPVLLYLAAGVCSFCLNVPEMRGPALSYFMGFLRTAQVVLILPLTFMALTWREEDIRAMLRGYLLVCAAIAFGGVVAFAIGIRDGLYIYGMHKNSVGLSLAVGALIAFAALTLPASRTECAALTGNLSSRSLLAILSLCVLALDCSLARGAFLCFLAGLACVTWLNRCWRVSAVVAVGATLALLGVLLLLPKDSADYYENVSDAMPSFSQRAEQIERFREMFPAHWLLGDGFRARRDYLPHNLALTLLAENGVVGTALFLWALLAQLRVFRAGRRAFAQAPVLQWLCTVLIAASVAILVHAQFDPYWRRGPLLLPWAGVGVILALFRANRLTDGGAGKDEDAP